MIMMISWMTKDMYFNWLSSLNKRMSKMKQKFILLVNYCAAHLISANISNLKIEFLPPNCTSILQPIDQGIIKNIKVNFRRRLVENILKTLNIRFLLLDLQR